MPRLGWSTEEGTLIEWLKKDGDPVRTGDVVCVIESDKAQVEVESFDAGVLRIPADSPPLGAEGAGRHAARLRPRAGRGAAGRGARAAAPPLPAEAGARRVPPSWSCAQRTVAPASGAAARAGRQPAGAPGRGGAPAWTGRRSGEAAGRGASWSATSARRAPTGRAPCGGSSASACSASARTTVPVTLTTDADATELVRVRDALQAEARAAGAPHPLLHGLLREAHGRRALASTRP